MASPSFAFASAKAPSFPSFSICSLRRSAWDMCPPHGRWPQWLQSRSLGAILYPPRGTDLSALLPNLSKLLERIIADRLTYYFETHHLLAPTEYGFHQGRSTEDALWRLVSAASIAMQTRHRLTLVSLDIRGAYNTVWHTGLLWKLSSLRVPPDLIRWIAAYLSSRKAHVRVRSSGGPSSPHHGSASGLPPLSHSLHCLCQ